MSTSSRALHGCLVEVNLKKVIDRVGHDAEHHKRQLIGVELEHCKEDSCVYPRPA